MICPDRQWAARFAPHSRRPDEQLKVAEAAGSRWRLLPGFISLQGLYRHCLVCLVRAGGGLCIDRQEACCAHSALEAGQLGWCSKGQTITTDPLPPLC
jgi:hypothetical protein